MGKSESTKRVIAVSAMNEGQKEVLRTIAKNQVNIISGMPGTGKAQPLDSTVYCEDGPKLMKDIKLGDRVCTPDSKTAKVIGIFPQGRRDTYRLTFVDGSVAECCEDHLWQISERRSRDRNKQIVVDTKYLLNHLKMSNGDRNIYIKTSSPVNFNKKYLMIDPYIMGLLLGDGGFSSANIAFSSADAELIAAVSSSLEKGYALKQSYGIHDYRIVKETKNKLNGSQSNKYKDALRLYGLWGEKSEKKFIPEDYLYGSIEQRWGILQGLMDSDGGVGKNGQCYFSTSSDLLCKDFVKLVNSLGGCCSVSEKLPTYSYNGEKRKGKKNFICYLGLPDSRDAFRLTRKKQKAKPRINDRRRILDKIEKVEVKEMQCILIDSDDHLYLTDGFISTHNTHLAVGWALQEFINGRFDRLILTRPVVEAGESLGFLPGDAEQKIAPYMMPMNEILSQFFSQEDIRKLIEQKKIIILPIAYMRGCAQPLDEPVATPGGWVPMGEIKPGDMVIGSSGKPTKVLETFSYNKKKTYKVTFSDGSWTRCCDEHLWFTTTLSEKRHNKPGSVKSTIEILETLKSNFGQKNHEIPMIFNPVQWNDRKDPSIDPYVLGVLLGDGSLHESASISFTTADTQIVDEILFRLPNDMQVKYASELNYRIVKKDYKIRENSFRSKLDNYGLIGTKSKTKFIPDDYKYGSVETRLEIIRGLLDTDGCIVRHPSGKSRVTYYSTSEQLAQDFVEISESLGATASKRLRKFEKNTASRTAEGHKWRKTGDISSIWVVNLVSPGFNPFRLSRKADVFAKFGPTRCKRLISSIEYIGEEDSQCLLVDAKDSLYITRSHIVTHNTFKNACVIADEAQNMTKKQVHLLLTRLGSGSKIILTGDVEQSDLGYRKERYNGLRDALKRLQGVEGIGFSHMGYEWCVREPLVNRIDEAYREIEEDTEFGSDIENIGPASFETLLNSGALDDLDGQWEDCDCEENDPDCDCEEY